MTNEELDKEEELDKKGYKKSFWPALDISYERSRELVNWIAEEVQEKNIFTKIDKVIKLILERKDLTKKERVCLGFHYGFTAGRNQGDAIIEVLKSSGGLET